jgi:diguanylate cyclase (GGDEF)-like protein
MKSHDKDFINVSIDHQQTAVWVYDIDNACIVAANNSALILWRCKTKNELFAKDFNDGMSSAVKARLEQYQKGFYSGATHSEIWQFSPKGIETSAFCMYSGFRMPNGKMAMLVEATPIARLSQSTKFNTLMIANISKHGQVVSANPPFKKYFANEINDISKLFVSKENFKKIQQISQEKAVFQDDVLLTTQYGERWFHIHVEPINEQKADRRSDDKKHAPISSSPSEYVVSLSNIHERKTLEHDLKQQLKTDSLTGLLSRKGLLDEIDRCVGNKQAFALFYFDLDGFKTINDSLGHASGDMALKEVAQRLTSEKERLAIQQINFGRFGGDEFLAIIPIINQQGSHQTIATQFVTKLAEPYQDELGNIMALSVSIGIASYPDDSSDKEHLIMCADSAMYHAKKHGKNRFIRYKHEMEMSLLRLSKLARHLNFAVENKELSLHYQPIVDSNTREIVGFEALLRWFNSQFKQINPQEAIKVAEETGLINKIENWVINQALTDLATLRTIFKKPVTMSINISSQHMAESSFIESLNDKLSEHGFIPQDISLELTETVLMQSIDTPNNPSQKVTREGYTLHIDDFGTGYSSLAYLHKIPASVVKVDRSFVNDDKELKNTLKFMQAMLTELKFKSLIEGVETEEQALALTNLGFDYQQGYFHGRPQPLSYYRGSN